MSQLSGIKKLQRKLATVEKALSTLTKATRALSDELNAAEAAASAVGNAAESGRSSRSKAAAADSKSKAKPATESGAHPTAGQGGRSRKDRRAKTADKPAGAEKPKRAAKDQPRKVRGERAAA